MVGWREMTLLTLAMVYVSSQIVHDHEGNSTTSNPATTSQPKCDLGFVSKTAGIIIGICFAASFVFVFVFLPLLICICGFTCCGVRGGSCAASCQSSIGDVEEGSCFACCQSAGAGGKCCTMLIVAIILGMVSSVIAGVAYILPMC